LTRKVVFIIYYITYIVPYTNVYDTIGNTFIL